MAQVNLTDKQKKKRKTVQCKLFTACTEDRREIPLVSVIGFNFL